MKVALVSSGSGSRGGGEIYLVRLAEGLSGEGADVHALLPDAEDMDELAASFPKGATVTRFPFTSTYRRRSRTLGAILDRAQHARVATLFRRVAPDIVHINQQVAEDGIDLILAARASCIPYISTIHVGYSARELGASLGRLRDTVTMRALNQIGADHIAVSTASRDQLAARFDNVQLHVVHNGVAVPNPADLVAARAHARADWGAADDEVVVGAVGRIEAQKNPLALVDHMRPTTTEPGRVRLVWIGDGTLRADLEAHATVSADTLPLVVDGWRADAALRVAGLDVFMLPSRFEGLPLAILEAMHAGLPTIGARSDGITEAVRDGETGFLCGSTAEWCEAAANLVADYDLRVRLGKAARADATAHFSVRAMTNATLDIYKNRISDFHCAG